MTNLFQPCNSMQFWSLSSDKKSEEQNREIVKLLDDLDLDDEWCHSPPFTCIPFFYTALGLEQGWLGHSMGKLYSFTFMYIFFKWSSGTTRSLV